MRVKILLILLLLFALSFSSSAKVYERLSVEGSAKLATHIVVATEGYRIDGQLVVEETLKGDLQLGENLIITELEAFSSQESRAVECLFPHQLCREDLPKDYVTGSRMILFLKKQPSLDSDSSMTIWAGIGERMVFQTTIWIEGRRSFAFYSASKDKKGTLADFEQSEEEIKILINKALEKGVDDSDTTQPSNKRFDRSAGSEFLMLRPVPSPAPGQPKRYALAKQARSSCTKSENYRALLLTGRL